MIDDALLSALLRIPFLSLANAALLLDAPHATVDRATQRLMAERLVERVSIGRDKTRLYCLTDDGVIALAHAHGVDPAALASGYDLGRRALLARLPALDRALDAQNAFVPLVRELMTASGAVLRAYRLGSLRWDGGSGESLPLDGHLALETAAGRCHVGLLWDGAADVPASILHERLRRLQQLDEDFAVPPVLVVTANERRVPWPYPGGVLWTTDQELWTRGPLDARWILPTPLGPGMYDSLPQMRPLLDALATLPRMGRARDPVQLTSRAVCPGRRLNLEGRLAALRRGAVERVPSPPGLLALALPPRAVAALEVVGRHPLLRAPQIAEVCLSTESRMRQTLALLSDHGLVAPQECGRERVGRYVLTDRGLRLLAARAGLPVALYRDAYGVLEDREPGIRRGLDFAAANLEHTIAIQEVFFAFLRAARARGAHLSWQGEWDCTRTFEWEEEQYRLRPDAEALFDDGKHRLQLFVEVDRSTALHEEIAAQVVRYSHYARSQAGGVIRGARRRSEMSQVLVAFIAVKSDERARNVITIGNAVLAANGDRALDVRATSLKRLLRRGPLDRVWRRVREARLTTLLPERH